MCKNIVIFLFCSIALFLFTGCASRVLLGATFKNYVYCADLAGSTLVTGGGGGVETYDVSAHMAFRKTSSVFTGCAVAGFAVRWPKVFAACGGSGLMAVSFKDPQNPVVEKTYDLQMNALAVDIIDSFALVLGMTNYRGYLKVVALDRDSLRVTDSFSIAGSISSICCKDSTVFVSGTESWTGFLRTYALNAATGKIRPLSGISLDAPAWRVSARGQLAVVAQGDKGVFFARADGAGRLVQTASTKCGKFTKEAAITDSLVFALDEKQGITVLDLNGNIKKTVSIKGISHFVINYPYIYACLVDKSIRVLTYE